MNKAKIIAAFLAISTITLQSCSISRRIQRNTWQAEEIHRSSFVQDSTIADLMRRLQINRDISITIWSQPDSTGQQYATQTIQIKESVQDSTTVHTEQHRQQQEQTEQTVVIRQTENKETDVNKNSIWKIFLIALCVVVIWGMVRRGKC